MRKRTIAVPTRVLPMALRHAVLAAAMIAIASCGASPAPFRDLDAPTSRPAGSPGHLVEEHAVRGAVIRDAVERGDLEAARQAANALVELVTRHERPTPSSSLDAMVQAARRVAAARDLRDAATSFAALAGRCGECHTQVGGPTSSPAAAPREALGVVPQMRRHHWGAARLWEGLVAPSDESWRSGAAVLSAAPLRPEVSMGQTLTPEVDALIAAVHDLGVRAADATNASSRIAVYGDLLTTCAACHERAHGGPR